MRGIGYAAGASRARFTFAPAQSRGGYRPFAGNAAGYRAGYRHHAVLESNLSCPAAV